MASFGNIDLLRPINKYLEDYLGDFSREKVELDLINRFYQVMVKIKINQEGVLARKEWLINNSRCCEVLESEFFYQLFPSLDFALYDLDQ
jgi:hypothetical protein